MRRIFLLLLIGLAFAATAPAFAADGSLDGEPKMGVPGPGAISTLPPIIARLILHSAFRIPHY
jgi:hypothetical protein